MNRHATTIPRQFYPMNTKYALFAILLVCFPLVTDLVAQGRPGRFRYPVIEPNKSKMIEFEEPISSLAAAGGGKYLVLHFRKQKKLVVFDTKILRAVKEFSLPSGNVSFAGGEDKLVIFSETKKTLDRYSLDMFQKEISIPTEKEIVGLHMGSQSRGPLMVVAKEPHSRSGRFHSLDTLLPMTLKKYGRRTDEQTIPVAQHVRCASDGRVFVHRGSNSGGTLLVSEGNLIPFGLDRFAWTVPLNSGDMVVGGQRRHTVFRKTTAKGPGFPYLVFPSADGTFLVGFTGDYTIRPVIPSIRVASAQTPLAILPKLEFNVKAASDTLSRDLDLIKRVHVLPSEKRIIVIPNSYDQLHVYSIDFEKLLRDSNLEFFFAATRPIDQIIPGQIFEHQVEAKSNALPVRFKLESGPEGMRVSEDGVVRWNVPSELKKNYFPVRISITNSTGKAVEHKFTVESKKHVTISEPSTSVAEAAKTGDIEALDAHLEYGTDFRTLGDRLASTDPLSIAVLNRQHEAAKWLLDNGKTFVRVDNLKPDLRRRKIEQSPLLHAILLEDEEMIKMLVASGIKRKNLIKKEDPKDTWRMLVWPAVENRKSKVLKLIVKQGVNVSVDMPNRNDVESIKFLQSHGASIDGRNDMGETALHTAARIGNLETTKYLVEEGADLDARVEPPKMVQPRSGQFSKRGSTEQKEKTSPTSLALAITHGHAKVVKYLVEAGADVKVTVTDQGGNLIHLAVVKERPHYAIFLAKSGVDINAKDDKGCTPLHRAIELWRPPVRNAMVRALVEEGADVNAETKYGRPLEWAKRVRNGKEELVKYLEKNGAR